MLATLIGQIQSGSRAVMGVMLESNIGAGNQPLNSDRSRLEYGVSVTDPWIDWPTTEQCLLGADPRARIAPPGAALRGG